MTLEQTADHYLDKYYKALFTKYINDFTSGTLVSYGVLRKTGALSLISETRTIIGMFLLRLLARLVHDTCLIIFFFIKMNETKRK